MGTRHAPLGSRWSSAFAIGGVVLAGFGLIGPAQADNHNPPGNNGTVKIDGVEFDSHPNNQPHVGCTFQVDFYGFDEGVGTASVAFELQPPTAGGRTLSVTSGDLTPDIGEDPAGGGTDVDAQETYTLAFTGDPHPQQGYHVKLTVNAPGSIGADTKFKVFWVTGCGAPPPTTPPPSTTPPVHTTAPTTTKPPVSTPPGDVPPPALETGIEPQPWRDALVPAGLGLALLGGIGALYLRRREIMNGEE